MRKITVLFLLLVFMVSCSNSENYEKISGDWECLSWYNESKEVEKCNNNVHFSFQTDKSYYSILGNATDSGTYKIMDDKLYVTPDGKMEFAVQITKLNSDTLELLMNQAGDEEILTLKRMKE